MAYDGASAADYANRYAEPKSVGRCAQYLRKAIEWGGVYVAPTLYAKDMGRKLEAAGFREAI